MNILTTTEAAKLARTDCSTFLVLAEHFGLEPGRSTGETKYWGSDRVEPLIPAMLAHKKVLRRERRDQLELELPPTLEQRVAALEIAIGKLTTSRSGV